MTKTFVAINDPVHSLMRSITRGTPLRAGLSADPRLRVQYCFREQDLPESYYSLAMFHGLGGLSLAAMRQTQWRVCVRDKAGLPARVNYFDALKLDRRCARDLRLKLKRHGPCLLSGELLSFGTGTLRARNDDPVEPIHHYLECQFGHLISRQENVYARIRALHWNSLPLLYMKQKESFDSTNMIFGDVLGELEQLWDRRADTEFLEQVAGSLQRMQRQPEIAACLRPPLNLEAIMKLHLRCQGIWKHPPANGRVLLRRVEAILDQISFDDSPLTMFRRQEPQPQSQPVLPTSDSAGWKSDRAGYDGWLSGNSDVP